MRRWAVAVAVVIGGCSPAGQPVGHVTAAISPATSPAISSEPTGKVQAPPPNASPSPDLPLTFDNTITCKLPVMSSTGYPSFTGAFITFPRATLAYDPRGGYSVDSNGEFLTTQVTPVLKGTLPTTGQPFYDLALGRWLPAGAGQSTADGTRYAYTVWDATQSDVTVVHIVEVATGKDTAFRVAMPVQAQGLEVADFDSSGVYLLANSFEQLPQGVWLMDATTGALRRVMQVGAVAAVRGGYAWTAAIDPRDPSPPQLRRSGTPSDSLVRVDLRTGVSAVWFYRPGKQVSLIGFGSGTQPVVQVTDPNDTTGYVETWLIADALAPVQVSAGHLFLADPQGDGGRLWFSGLAGVYLYTRVDGLRKIAALNLADNQSITVVGECR
jgi:hypothetical protein